jgi:hypothetical protein
VPIILRKATLADIPQLEALIARSARGLSAEDYRPSQIEGALRGAFAPRRQTLCRPRLRRRAHGAFRCRTRRVH